jgi:predicted transcriptional regulator YdeE
MHYDDYDKANDLWRKFLDSNDIQDHEKVYGVCVDTSNNSIINPTLDYMAGVGEAQNVHIPKGHNLTSINIDAGHYSVFTHNGSLNDIGTLLNHIWQIWVPRSKYTLKNNHPDFETYDHNFDHKTESGLIKIWIPIESP